MRKWIVPAAIVAALTLPVTGAAGATGIDVSFQKQLVDPAFVFQGTTGGAAKGTLTSTLVSCEDCSGAVWALTFDWLVTADQPAKSFLARTSGTFDTTTGAVILDGLVCSGWHAGAAVHEEGTLTDPATLSFAGNIHILPGSSAGGAASTVVCR